MNHHRIFSCVAALTSALAIAGPALAAPLTLYDGSLGTRPDQQGWTYRAAQPVAPFFPIDATNVASPTFTTLNTTADNRESAGYFTRDPLGVNPSLPALPTLDHASGFTVSFGLNLLAEHHLANDRNGDSIDDRGGYSVIALSSDLLGIELAFWQDQIFAYDYRDLGGSVFEFIHDESTAAFNPLGQAHDYALTLQGSTYTLRADNIVILTGALRDYSHEAVINPLAPVYAYPSFLFLGDDTSKADSQTQLSYVTLTIIPEPTTIALLLLPAACGLALPRPRRPHLNS